MMPGHQIPLGQYSAFVTLFLSSLQPCRHTFFCRTLDISGAAAADYLLEESLLSKVGHEIGCFLRACRLAIFFHSSASKIVLLSIISHLRELAGLPLFTERSEVSIIRLIKI